MIRIHHLAAAMVLGALLAPAASRGEEKNEIKTVEVARPLIEAQKALKNNQLDTALAEIQKAQAVQNKTPYEAYRIDEFLASVLNQQKKYAEGVVVLERVLASGFLAPDQADATATNIANTYFQLHEYKKAAAFIEKWLEQHPNDEDMRLMLGQSQYMSEDYKGAAKTMTGLIAAAEKAGRKPREDWIKIVQTSQYKLNNTAGEGAALKKMVRYYPSEAYWNHLIGLYRNIDKTDPVVLGFYRLMDETGTLKAADNYFEMGQLLLQVGASAEAQRIAQQGLKNADLQPAERGRLERIITNAKQQSSTKAKPDRIPNATETQLNQGIDQLKKGRKDAARKAFKAVADDPKWNNLAELWELRVPL